MHCMPCSDPCSCGQRRHDLQLRKRACHARHCDKCAVLLLYFCRVEFALEFQVLNWSTWANRV
jgi:hypothetical protein